MTKVTLTREAILKADDLRQEAVDVPEWGGQVFVRTMTGTGRDTWEAEMVQGKDKVDMENFRARLAVRVLADEKGERLFKDGDAHRLGLKSARVLARIYDKARELNGLSNEDAKELVKNSGSAPSDKTGSD